MTRKVSLGALLIAMIGTLSGCVAYETLPAYSERPVYRSAPVPRDAPVYRRDSDRDGVPDRVDRDRDGDRVPNRYDQRPDNPRLY